MSERIIVCFYSKRVKVRLPEQANHLQTARSLTKRAAARGGNVVAWGARSVAFDFDFDAAEDAIEFASEEVNGDDVPFGIGIAQGEQEPIDEMVAGYTLSWGPALVRAEALARIAREGEVLLEPNLDPIRTGELLTRGRRLRALGKDRVKGLLLDSEHPWRGDLAAMVSELMTPLLIGRPQLGEMLVPAGNLGIVRAARGLGGSRFLGELARTLEPGRVLRLSPSLMGEPFGALRRGLLKARSRGQAPAVLEGVHAESLESLLGGEGLDLDSCAGLLRAWLKPASERGPSGAMLLDDVHDIDSDTLEAIRVAIEDMPFRLVVRAHPGARLPDAIADLSVVVEVKLGALEGREAVDLARAWLNGELDDGLAERFAKLGQGEPLSVSEALAEALEAGELVWEDHRAVSRRRRAGRGDPHAAEHWIARRARHLEAGPRAVLFALAVLGGEADAADVRALVERASDVQIEFDKVVRALEASRWLRRPSPELLSLPSASHREAIAGQLSSPRVAAWHRAAAVVLANNNRPLCAASASAHAMLGGDFDSAARMARRAAASARAVDLGETADALETFCDTKDPGLLSGRGLSSSVFPVDLFSEQQRIPVSALPSDSRPPPPPQIPRPPKLPARIASPRLPGADVLAFAAAGPMSAPGVRRSPGSGATRQGPPPLPPRASQQMKAQKPISIIPDEELELASEEPTTGVRNELALKATELMRRGDWAAVAKLAEHLRASKRHLGLAERLDALVKLGEGDALEALGTLRRAAESATSQASGDRCRAALAHAIGLGAAGRGTEALLEALSGLAYAREADDRRGELACTRFIAQLSEAAGHTGSGARWKDAAERIQE
ncbi:MAG: hypothetical protein R3B89_25020 [Polyangiaceae bacterium]